MDKTKYNNDGSITLTSKPGFLNEFDNVVEPPEEDVEIYIIKPKHHNGSIRMINNIAMWTDTDTGMPNSIHVGRWVTTTPALLGKIKDKFEVKDRSDENIEE